MTQVLELGTAKNTEEKEEEEKKKTLKTLSPLQFRWKFRRAHCTYYWPKLNMALKLFYVLGSLLVYRNRHYGKETILRALRKLIVCLIQRDSLTLKY